jgi:iron complex outermembrane receptor protein
MSLASLTLLLLAGTAPAPDVQPMAQVDATAPAADPAADAAPDPTASSDSNLITVTARRREENVQDVSLAVSVISGAELANSGVFNVNRLQQQLPALQFYSSNPRNSAINIRGLGAPFGLTNDGIEQGVGFYVDQVYIGRIGASTLDFVDVERVEILRGPQGTLYGKNTTAGAINITTRAPSFTPEGRVEVSDGNYGFFQLKTSLSAPIADDTLAFRLSTSLSLRKGTIYNVASDENLHRQRNFGARGQLLWRPAENLDFTFSGDFNRPEPAVLRAILCARRCRRSARSTANMPRSPQPSAMRRRASIRSTASPISTPASTRARKWVASGWSATGTWASRR